MNCVCEFLYDILPTTSGKIQAWAALGTLGITGLMAYYAKQALDAWKDQDRHKTIMTLIKESHKTVKAIKDLRRSQNSALSDTERNAIIEMFPDTYYLVLKSENMKVKLERNQSVIDVIEEMKLSAISTLENEHPMRVFYQFVSDLLSKMQESSISYSIATIDREPVRKDMLKTRDEVTEVSKMNDADFKSSSFAYKYESKQEALTVLTELKEDSEVRYRCLLETIKECEIILFSSIYFNPSSIDDEISDQNKMLNQFVQNYNSIFNRKSKTSTTASADTHSASSL